MSNPIAYLAAPYGGSQYALDAAEAWLGILVRIFPDIDFAAPWISWCRVLPETMKERGIAFDRALVQMFPLFFMVGDCAGSTGAMAEFETAMAAGKVIVDLAEFKHLDPRMLARASEPEFDFIAEQIRSSVSRQIAAAAEDPWPSAHREAGMG